MPTIKISQTLDFLNLNSAPSENHHAVRKEDLAAEVETLETAIEQIKTLVNSDGTLDSLQEITNYLTQNAGAQDVINLAGGRLEDHDSRLAALEGGTSVSGQISTSATGDNAIHASAGGITTATTAAGVVSAGGQISTTSNADYAIDAPNGGIKATKIEVQGHIKSTGGGDISTSVGDITTTGGQITTHAIKTGVDGNELPAINAVNGFIRAGSASNNAIYAENGGVTAKKTIESTNGDIKITNGIVAAYASDASEAEINQAKDESSFLYFGTKWRINGQNDGTHLVFEWNAAVDGAATADWRTAVPFIVGVTP